MRCDLLMMWVASFRLSDAKHYGNGNVGVHNILRQEELKPRKTTMTVANPQEIPGDENFSASGGDEDNAGRELEYPGVISIGWGCKKLGLTKDKFKEIVPLPDHFDTVVWGKDIQEYEYDSQAFLRRLFRLMTEKLAELLVS
ncbi:hypothetical protein DKX38_026831 [Salix brachista]|uniref:Uncharacterized protein n=1 Tax=Salix brachista TaxID=2182728 RepID=A0A5N5JFR1_9ROSI|nr:hypothetical protein DKX38_026831 [Salix brachista]